MTPYLELLSRVLNQGETKGSRAELLSTGAKPNTRSLFGAQMRFDLRDGFPLVTTKKVNFRHIAVELLWFLSGSTNVGFLNDHGVKIWNEWADSSGELGPVYGQQWRRWEGPDGQVVDQVAALIANIKAVRDDPQNPASRRLIVSSWNPVDVKRVPGPSACHTLFQFYVLNGELSCHLYQRSADLFLGVPYNIACYALLTEIIAKITGLRARDFIHSFGDAHIYENHVGAVDEQLLRQPLPAPRLRLDPDLTDIDNLRLDQLHLDSYQSHPAIRGEVAV